MSAILQTRGISKRFCSGQSAVEALKPTDFSVEPGEIVAVIGKSGSGKSTLLSVLGGLMPPDEGEVLVDGVSLYDIGEAQRTKLRTQKIGFIFQSFNLIQELTVLNNIRLPFDIARRPYDHVAEKEVVEMLGIEERLKFFPDQLSGGERQRVATARALLMKPAIILADEPTGNLDLESGQALMGFVKESNRAQGQTYVVVTHDMEWTKLADRVFRMSDGVLRPAE
jgi:putative ABC transport system ATP-binding protein